MEENHKEPEIVCGPSTYKIMLSFLVADEMLASELLLASTLHVNSASEGH